MTQFEEDGFLLAATGYTGHTCLLDDTWDGYISCQECFEDRKRDRMRDKVNFFYVSPDSLEDLAKELRKGTFE